MTAVMSPIWNFPAAMRPAVGLDGGGRVVGKGGDKAALLPRLIVEGTHHPHAGEVLQQDGAHPIQQLLQTAEQGSGPPDDEKGDEQDQHHHSQQDQSHLDVQPKGEPQGDGTDDGHGDDHLQGAGEGKLDGGDVGDGAGGDGGGAELAEVIDGQGQGFGVDGLAHFLAHLGGEGGAGVASQDGAPARGQGYHRHLHPGVPYRLKGGAGGAQVEHLRHQGGDEQAAGDLHHQQHHGEQGQLPVGPEEAQDQFHGGMLLSTKRFQTAARGPVPAAGLTAPPAGMASAEPSAALPWTS